MKSIRLSSLLSFIASTAALVGAQFSTNKQQPLCNSSLKMDCTNFEVENGSILLGFNLNYDIGDNVSDFFKRMNSVDGPSFDNTPPAAFGMYMKVGGKGLIGGGQLDTMLEQIKGRNAILVTSLDPVEGYGNVSQDGLEEFADKVANFNKFGIPVFIRPAHEMNGPWYIYGMQPTKFKAFYRNVYNTVKRKAPFAKFIFAPMEGNGYPWSGWQPKTAQMSSDDTILLDTNRDGKVLEGDNPYNPFYPGDNIVDWFGISLYWKGDYPYNVNQKCPATFFSDKLNAGMYPTYQFVQSHNKPIMITEMAGSYCDTNPGTSNLDVKQPFWRDAFGDETRKRYPLLKLALWFDYNKFEEGGQRDFSLSNTRGPEGGSLHQVAPAFKRDLAPMSAVVYASNVAMSESGNCGCFRFSSNGSGLNGPIPSPAPEFLADWEFCTANHQCASNCCSKEYSNDGKYKCTPGSSTCVDLTSASFSSASSETNDTSTSNMAVYSTTVQSTGIMFLALGAGLAIFLIRRRKSITDKTLETANSENLDGNLTLLDVKSEEAASTLQFSSSISNYQLISPSQHVEHDQLQSDSCNTNGNMFQQSNTLFDEHRDLHFAEYSLVDQ
ncbi:hypothetical protein HK098_007371 [Nowakowskiella sp. JEL0407]|nr:hypothetical protein HK098_007371 [Nowakowskiella sp. JEL0407]